MDLQSLAFRGIGLEPIVRPFLSGTEACRVSGGLLAILQDVRDIWVVV